jgi:hypothetical protein
MTKKKMARWKLSLLGKIIFLQILKIHGWKHIKVEYIILSQLVGLLFMGHATKYKWIIYENDSK